MSTSARQDFFVTGGALPPGAPSYVQRPADDDLLRLVSEGKFCHVLAPRQMGKSSLMVRTAERLREQGACTAFVGLEEIGPAQEPEWYLGLLTRLQSELDLSLDLQAWWNEQGELAVVQRFVAYLREVVLTQVASPIVIFLDEIDATLDFDFRDDFYAAIRATYDARAAEPEFNRLTFVLLGAATPDELMRDKARTPFDISQPLDLGDFTSQEVEVLYRGLEQACIDIAKASFHPALFTPREAQKLLQSLEETCADKASAVFDRILHWTGGHPYLTQKLCSAMLKVSLEQWNAGEVDNQVNQVFSSKGAHPDINLQAIDRNVTADPRRGRLLLLYWRVYQFKSIADNTRSLDHNRLKLIGLVRARQNSIEIRNKIYRRVFGPDWIKKNLFDRTKKSTREKPARRIAVIPAVIALILVAVAGFWAYQQRQATTRTQDQVSIDNLRAGSADTRVTSLAGLLQIQGKEDAARSLFDALDQRDKLALFNLANPKGVGPQLITVVAALYTDLPNDIEGNDVLRAMSAPLSQLDDPAARDMSNEIEQWLQGRAQFNDGKYDQALAAYSAAVRLNSRNPGTLLDRAQAHARQNQIGPALDDLASLLKVSSSQAWKERVQRVLESDPVLYSALWDQRQNYTALAELAPAPTRAPSPTTPPPSPTPTVLTRTDTPPPPTRTSTPAAKLPTVVLRLVSPAPTATCRNPIVLRWTGTLQSYEHYQVRMRYKSGEFGTVDLMRSNKLGSPEWAPVIPDRMNIEGRERAVYGQLEWQVMVIDGRSGESTSTSDWSHFFFSQLDGQPCP